jgi:hypothetical protein
MVIIVALIEQLENDNWQERLRMFFETTLNVLKNDPYQHVGSSIDDLRAWIRQGGLKRVKENLSRQMEIRQFSDNKKESVLNYLETLIQENRLFLLELVNQKIIPPEQKKILLQSGFSEGDIEGLINRILAGERPFEDWMYSHGYSNEDIKKIYTIIDNWLMDQGIIPIPPSKMH